MITAIFRDLCPNCGGPISSERLELGLPCEKCLPHIEDKFPRIRGKLSRVWEIEKGVREIDELFIKAIGSRMWGLQRLWARRFLNKESFAMVAPTGSGKTTMQIILSLYAADRGQRILIMLPTSLLAHQVHQKVLELRSKLGYNDVLVSAYHSLLTDKQKRLELENVVNASIIITTPISLMKREELQQPINVAFIDDVDSFLRRSKSVDVVLRMLNVTPEEVALIEKAQKMESEARKLAKEDPEKARQLVSEAAKLKTDVRLKVKGQVIVSGATQTARRTKRVRILNALFGFTVGGKVEVGRNIVDMYIKPPKELFEKTIVDVVKKLGTGGLVFVPMDKGAEYVKRITDILKQHGVNAEAYLGTRRRLFEKFIVGDVDVLVGIASYRSPLTRGIDLPERVRYAVFTGVPKFRLRISFEEFHPSRWLILLNEIRDAVYEKYPYEFDRVLGGLIKVRLATRDTLEAVREALKTGRTLTGFPEFVRKVAEDSLNFLIKVIEDEEVRERLRRSETITFGEKAGEYFFIIPDATAYIQASGRTSRLYVGGITKGISVLVIDEIKAFNALIRDLKWLLETVEFRKYEEVDIDKLMREVDEDRRKVRLALEGKLKTKERELMKTTLFIVESPNKARTIARLFGRPTRKTVGTLQTFEVLTENRLMIVTATGGHILDLVSDEGLFGVNVVDRVFQPVYKPIKKCIRCGRDVPEEESTCPYCGGKVLIESKPVIKALRHLAAQVDEILVGTDPDSEGEKIAWDVTLLLKPLNKNIWRVRFHEVTRRGLIEALNNLSTIDKNMVKAQIIRRIEDRWIGFSLSPILWKRFGMHWLSAGRVQTPVLGWIVERTMKNKRKAELITIKLKGVNLSLTFKAPKGLAEKIGKQGKIIIENIKDEIVEINPPPPFTTDAMLAEGSRILGLPAPKIMDSAQRLFEAGLITYHRTDSTTVSGVGIGLAKDYITRVYGAKYFKARKWEKPGAHECIRPTKPLDSRQIRSLRAAGVLRLAVPLRPEDYKLYDIIFRRFIISQMAPAKVMKRTFTLRFEDFTKEFTFLTKIIEEGFLRLSKTFVHEEVSKLTSGEYEIEELQVRLIPEYPLYTYGEVVEEMKTRGIGRPSTYAKILSILRRRGYILEVGKGKLVATNRGKQVFEYLIRNFGELISEERTRKLQEVIDMVELGKEDITRVLNEFYRETCNIIIKAKREGVTYPTETPIFEKLCLEHS